MAYLSFAPFDPLGASYVFLISLVIAEVASLLSCSLCKSFLTALVEVSIYTYIYHVEKKNSSCLEAS